MNDETLYGTLCACLGVCMADADEPDAYFPMGRLTDRDETNRTIARFHTRRCDRVCRALGSVSSVRSAVSTRRGFGRCIAMPSQ